MEEHQNMELAIVESENLEADSMGDFELVVGQQFSDVKAFRKAMKDAAIAQHFEIKIIKSDLTRYFARCAKEGCPWRIRALKLPNVPTFTIRSIEGSHTCGHDAMFGHNQASVDWIVNLIEERLRDDASYKPKDILQDIQKQYGITVPYKQAWRAKERGLTVIYGSSEEGYCHLPSYCERIKKSNVGSVAQVFTAGSEHRFQRIFISFHASIHGFLHGCLPVVSLGVLPLRSKYLGSLLSVSSFDADGGLFPVAFGIVDVETDETWMWFLSEFHKLIEMRKDDVPRLTILSDGRARIAVAVRRKFPTAHHGVCVRHMADSMSEEFKNSRLGGLIWNAARSVTVIGFRERMAEIEEACPDAARWIREIPTTRWVVAHLDGPRFGHLASNAEEFNRWITDARELPIVQVIEQIHDKLTSAFNERRSKGSEWTSTLAPSAENRLMEAVERSGKYRVLRSDEVEFEVLTAERSDIVNIGARVCSCRDWQLHGMPCSHAAAALLSCGKDVFEYTDECFSVARYRETYSQPMHPVRGKREWGKEGTTDDDDRVVRPPKFRRPPGRPEKKRVGVEEYKRTKQTVHCSRCNQTGHYKRTCKAELGTGEIVAAIEN